MGFFSDLWSGIKNISGYSKYAKLETITAHPLGDSEHGVLVDRIEFVAASNKLKDCDAKDKSSYKDRKRLGIKMCVESLTTNNGFTDKIDYFDKHKKKDDLADSFLQGMWFITDREL